MYLRLGGAVVIAENNLIIYSLYRSGENNLLAIVTSIYAIVCFLGVMAALTS